MNIKIKKLHPDAKMPFRANATDAGADLYATDFVNEGDNIIYSTGLAFEIPKGYMGLLVNRSSIKKTSLMINLGVIDSDYRGEVKVVFKKNGTSIYRKGARVAQLLIVPIELATFEEVSELSDTGRGCGGFGSTGK